MTGEGRRRFIMALGLGLAGLARPISARARRGRLDGASLGLEPGASHDQSARLKAALMRAARLGAVLELPGGRIFARDVSISAPVRMTGRPGARLACAPGGAFLLTCERGPVEISDIAFDGQGAIATGERGGLLRVHDCRDLSIRRCAFSGGAGNGLVLTGCKGLVRDNRFSGHGRAAIFSIGGREVRITGNRVSDCANNGILVWQEEKRFDGSVVRGNVIRAIRADAGGDGPNGNGVNIFRAGGVTVAGNVIRDCTYSAVRDNSGDDCRILRNDCRDIGEVAIFVEFAFVNARVEDNRIERASAGIAITNADHGGHGAIVRGNVIREMSPRISSPDVLGYGIWAEDRTLIENNVVEDAATAGLWLGWGKYLRDVTARGNILRRCGVGIAVSFAPGAGAAVITGNRIEAARKGAIIGFDHEKAVTGDLLNADTKIPARLVIGANSASR